MTFKGEVGKDETGEYAALVSKEESNERLRRKGPAGILNEVVNELVKNDRVHEITEENREQVLGVMLKVHELCVQLAEEKIAKIDYEGEFDRLEETNEWLADIYYERTGTTLSRLVVDLAEKGHLVPERSH